MGIVSKIFIVIFSVSLGIGQGYQPVCGYNYYAKRYDRVKESLLFTFYIMIAIITSLSALFFIFSDTVMAIFRDDPEVIKIGSKALKWQCAALPFVSLNVICNMTYQSTKQKFKASLLSCCRQGLFFIPLIIVLPLIVGIDGVIVTQACADFMTFIFTVFFFIHLMRDINKKVKSQNLSFE